MRALLPKNIVLASIISALVLLSTCTPEHGDDDKSVIPRGSVSGQVAGHSAQASKTQSTKFYILSGDLFH